MGTSDRCKDHVLWVYSNRHIDSKYGLCDIKTQEDAHKWLMCNEPTICEKTEDYDCADVQCREQRQKPDPRIEPIEHPENLPSGISEKCKIQTKWVYDNRDLFLVEKKPLEEKVQQFFSSLGALIATAGSAGITIYRFVKAGL